LRSKENTDTLDQNKKEIPNQPKKIKTARVAKTLQSLSTPNQNPPGPTIVDITHDQPPNEKPSTLIPSKVTVEKSSNIILENPREKTSNAEEEEKPNPNPSMKIPNPQIGKAPLPFNLGA